MTLARHAAKRARLLDGVAALGSLGPRWVSAAKPTSNLFRDRVARPAASVTLAGFNEVVAVDEAAGEVVVEGLTTYADLVDATLPHRLMPAVVPQLRSITVGGALAGVGIEATSFRHGLVHHTARSLDILTGDGRIVTCTRDNEHRDLFLGFPNSYGTLGYVVAATMAAIPVLPCVHLEHTPIADPAECFARIAAACADPANDFVEATVFAPGEHYLTCARFVAAAPRCSDYGFERIYYRSIPTRREDWLGTREFLWRWDTDWFWCSKQLFADRPLVRRLLGRRRLNSITYQRVMRWNSRWGVTRRWNRLLGRTAESVIQDVDIPLDRCREFLTFLHAEVGILPIWLCPLVQPSGAGLSPLYPMRSGELYVNFGFWDVVTTQAHSEPGHLNRRIERKVAECGGIKSLYSEAFYPESEFRAIYGYDAYRSLKARYDPRGTLGDLYDKCVRRH